MKLKLILIAMILSIIIIPMPGCSPSQTLARSEQARQTGIATSSKASEITALLDRYPPGVIEDGLLAQLLIQVMPARWVDQFQDFIDGGEQDIRIVAQDIAASLEVTATDLMLQADVLEAKAAEESNQWDNFLTIAGSGLQVLTQPQGAVMIGLGLLTAGFRKKQKAETQRADQNTKIARGAVDTSTQLRDISENLINSIEVWKSTESGSASWKNGGRDPLIAAQTDQTMNFVANVKARRSTNTRTRAKPFIQPGTTTFNHPQDQDHGEFPTEPMPAPKAPGTPDAPTPEDYQK